MGVDRMSIRNKLLNGSIAVVILAAATWAFLELAPIPQARNEELAQKGQQLPESLNASTAVSESKAEVAPPAPMLNLLGAEIARGDDPADPADYLARLEASYLVRGYQPLPARGRRSLKKSSGLSKLYWRSKVTGVEMICAI